MDYKIKIKTNQQFLDVFNKIKKFKVEIPTHIMECFSANLLDLEGLEWFSQNLKNIDGPPLHTLITEESIVLPSPKVVEPSLEYKENIRKLKERLKNKEYDAITKNVDFRRVRLNEDTISYQSGYILHYQMICFQIEKIFFLYMVLNIFLFFSELQPSFYLIYIIS